MNFLRRKASKLGGGDKSNKDNAKKANRLAVIEDNEPATENAEDEASTTSSTSNRDRRPSVAETIDSTSANDSKKKKESYWARSAAESQASPQPWMNVSAMSQPGLALQENKPKKTAVNGSISSARASVDSVPASNLSIQMGETSTSANYPPAPMGAPPKVPHGMALPMGRRSPSNPNQLRDGTHFPPPSPSYPPSRNSLKVPHSPTVQNTPPILPLKTPRTGSMPPPMPSSAPPPPPPPATIAPLGPLANPFRDEAPAQPAYTETVEVSPLTSRPPPPPPPPPTAPSKLQRSPSRPHGPPPSSFSKHKRTLSGRVSPSPVNLPSPPVPPPPPPAPAASSQSSNQATDSIVSSSSANPHGRQESLSAFPSPASSTKSPERTQHWDSWIPDPSGYYGGPASFVVELESISKSSEPPSIAPGTQHQELESPADSQEKQMQAEEDFRETSKVLIPEGMTHPLPTPSDRTFSRNDSIFSYVQPCRMTFE
ncbi:hypothetical protein AA313_de0209556 [Arthrobotrys entomopaga]|nr:hypothetical protein AA313_de0209556 [Arthrobotrys entomopaga]